MSGVIEVQGWRARRWVTAVAQFYMTFLGPLQFIEEDGTPIAVISWEEAQGLWAAQKGQTVPS